MRTTINIPEDLIEEALTLSKAKTKSQVVKKALKVYINTIKRQRLIALKGTLDFDIDLDTLRERKDVEV